MIDLSGLRLGVGEQRRETIEVDLEPLEFGGLEYRARTTPLPVELTITRLRNAWVFEESLDAELEGSCHRCLGPAELDVAVGTREYHSEAADRTEDEICEYLTGDEFDAERMAADAIVTAMPFQILCRDDCAGLCPTCGQDLNVAPCECPPAERENPFAKLRELFPEEQEPPV